MPLTVYTEDEVSLERQKEVDRLFEIGRGTSAGYIGYAGTGFYVSRLTAPPKAPVITADGALTCVIILVHFSNGTGALGHFMANPEPKAILQAVEQMVSTGQATDLEAILFSAGMQGTVLETIEYRQEIVDIVRQRYLMEPPPRVEWIHPPTSSENDIYGGCLYLPSLGKAVFIEMQDLPHAGNSNTVEGMFGCAFKPYEEKKYSSSASDEDEPPYAD